MDYRKLLLTMLLLLVGVSMQAQSISAAQMDERFNDNKLPYGWFAEGWIVKDNVAQKSKKDDSAQNDENGTPTFNMEELMGGGGSSLNYLMTPPLNVESGEVLAFSAKKGKDDDSGIGSFMGGDSDSTFVVERAVYGEHRWIKVADFTTQLDSVYKTFTISNTEAGEYRFRFRAAGKVMIDSVAGFHIDTEAPDIYPVYQDKNIQPIDLGVCTTDTTMIFKVINTATGTLTVKLSAEGAYTLDNTQVSVAAADTATVNVTFNYNQAHEGRNSTMLTFMTTDERVEVIPLPIDAIVSQQGVWVDDFNNNALSEGWFTEGWEAKEGVATVKKSSDDGGMGGMFGGSSETYYLMTPPLTVNDENDVLFFSVKKPGGGMDLGSMMGGSSGSSFFIEKSVYGSGKWELAKDFTNALDTVYTTQWLSSIEPGEYRFRFVASDSIVIDSVAGFQIDMNAPDLYVTLDSAVVKRLDFGTLKADTTKTFTVINTGTGVLDVNISSLDEKRLAIKEKSLTIAAGDSAYVDVTLLRDEWQNIEINEVLTFKPTDERISEQSVNFYAFNIPSDVWSEDFEPLYVIEDDTYPRMFPEGWTTTGWKLSQGGGNDIMAMFGGGGNEEQSWVATTDSEDYELITPTLQAVQGDILEFDANLGGGMDFMAMFGMGGGSSARLEVYYNRGNDDNWTLYGTYTETGTVYFTAPYSGIYQLKFKGSSVSLDNFEGFHAPLETVALFDGMDEQNAEVIEEYSNKKLNVSYDRVLNAEKNKDGIWTPQAHTICLPYDMDFNAYNEPGKVKLYNLMFIDNYYKHFIFMETSDKASAGTPYLAVVNSGSVCLDAYDVEMTNQVNANADSDQKVFDYEKWYFNTTLEQTGSWLGSFSKLSKDDKEAPKTYCLVDDGSWARLSKANEDMPGFRAYFYASKETLDDSYLGNQARTKVGEPDAVYQTKFYQQSEDSGSKGEVAQMAGLLYHGDISVSGSDVTGIQITIETIDADGTRNYYDMQGHRLNGKPQKGIYIENGKKHLTR